jgi:hypothetical protein
MHKTQCFQVFPPEEWRKQGVLLKAVKWAEQSNSLNLAVVSGILKYGE